MGLVSVMACCVRQDGMMGGLRWVARRGTREGHLHYKRLPDPVNLDWITVMIAFAFAFAIRFRISLS